MYRFGGSTFFNLFTTDTSCRFYLGANQIIPFYGMKMQYNDEKGRMVLIQVRLIGKM